MQMSADNRAILRMILEVCTSKGVTVKLVRMVPYGCPTSIDSDTASLQVCVTQDVEHTRRLRVSTVGGDRAPATPFMYVIYKGATTLVLKDQPWNVAKLLEEDNTCVICTTKWGSLCNPCCGAWLCKPCNAMHKYTAARKVIDEVGAGCGLRSTLFRQLFVSCPICREALEAGHAAEYLRINEAEGDLSDEDFKAYVVTEHDRICSPGGR